MEVPHQRNSRKENTEIKTGHIPKEWENDTHKLSQKDTDASCAYKSHECDEMLSNMKIENKIHEKGNRGTTLTQTQLERNRQKSKIRALVEDVFGFMEN